jgi:hypothetical protein
MGRGSWDSGGRYAREAGDEADAAARQAPRPPPRQAGGELRGKRRSPRSESVRVREDSRASSPRQTVSSVLPTIERVKLRAEWIQRHAV